MSALSASRETPAVVQIEAYKHLTASLWQLSSHRCCLSFSGFNSGVIWHEFPWGCGWASWLCRFMFWLSKKNLTRIHSSTFPVSLLPFWDSSNVTVDSCSHPKGFWESDVCFQCFLFVVHNESNLLVYPNGFCQLCSTPIPFPLNQTPWSLYKEREVQRSRGAYLTTP